MRLLTLLLSILVTFCAAGSPSEALDCRVSERPAATLLFPYFEVDLADPSGVTTSISIGSVSPEPILVNVVVWTDCAVPVLNFYLYLAGDAVRPLDLRSILAGGQLPVSGPGEGEDGFHNCSDPLNPPALDPAAQASLQARLAGNPDPDDGLCYGTHRPGSRLAVGYVTADAVQRCSGAARTPIDPGYFRRIGISLASNDNVLFGDFFLVDPGEDSARGGGAVSVVADAEHFVGSNRPGFYHNKDVRYPLASSYRIRHLAGGGFDGGTDVVLWFAREQYVFDPEPKVCGEGNACSGNGGRVRIRETSESGGSSRGFELIDLPAISRFTVGEEPLPVSREFGTLDFTTYWYCGICTRPSVPIDSWVMPLYSAQGRYSAELPPLQRSNPCR